MNNRRKGYLRDRKIIDALDYLQALNTEQVAELFFRDIKSGYRKAQERLRKLYERKRVKRFRADLAEPYIYYTGQRKSGRLEHLLKVNWVYVWLKNNKKGWETFEWASEQDYGILQADALASLYNPFKKEMRVWFIEVESKNHEPFNKVRKYNQLFRSGGYVGQWWVPCVDSFPPIVIVVSSEGRKKEIEAAIKRENINDLEFIVYRFEEILSAAKREVLLLSF